MPATVLILTATVAPPLSAPGMTRLDPALRMRDYVDALEFYLTFLGRGLDHIVLAENSASDISPLADVVARAGATGDVTLLSFEGNDHPAEYGRCYGEVRLLDIAMAKTRTHPWPADAVFWKATGRYKIVNLRRMLATRPAGVDFYVDLRNQRGRRWADMRVMSWTRRGYAEIMEGIAPALREDTRGTRPGEEAAFDILSDRMKASSLPTRSSFTAEPLIDGVRAFDDRNWSSGRRRVVYIVRSLQRRLLGRVMV